MNIRRLFFVALLILTMFGCGEQPTTAPPTVNAVNDQTINEGGTANLTGTASDDGLPNPPGALTLTWSKVSGPGTVSFGNASQASTSATFSTPGSYVLRLSASDGALSASDDVSVTVQAATTTNTPPTVNAGADQTVNSGSAASLSGSVSDDGLPNPPGALTLSWSKISGPGTVTFGNPNQASTSASFSAPGNYVLRLSASDGALSASDDVSVTVQAQPPTGNNPVVGISQAHYTPLGFDSSGNPLPVPSIDTAGILYHPVYGRLFATDSEIEEANVATVWNQVQANVFQSDLTASTLYDKYDLTPAALGTNKEPTGITYCPTDNHIYISNDDSPKSLFRYSFDGTTFTLSDRTTTLPYTNDPEGVTCDPATGRLYVIGGSTINIVIFTYTTQFVFQEELDLFETAGDPSGIPSDGEGIVFDPKTQHLFMVSPTDDFIYEYTLSGQFVQKFDLRGFSPKPKNSAGMTIGPSSADSSKESFYVVDRVIDNDSDPSERDGRLYEFFIQRANP